MDICQECYAIVPEHHTRCADCGAPVEQPETSPLDDLDEGLDPDEFLRDLLGEEQAGRPYFMPTTAPEPEPVEEEIPFSFDPTAYPPPPATAEVPPATEPSPPPPPPPPPPAPPSKPTSTSSLDELITSRPKPVVRAAPIAPPVESAPSPTVGGSSKNLSPPTSDTGIYAVMARSNRLDKSATLGRSKHHNLLLGVAALAGVTVFSLGSFAGWLASNRVTDGSGLPTEVAFSDGKSLPPAIASSLVAVQGVYCDGSTASGFATSGLVLIPADKDLTGVADIGTVTGTTDDGRFLTIKPTSNQSSLVKGKSGQIPDGRAVYVVDLSRIPAGGDPVVTEVEVASSTRTRGGSFRTFFTDSQLPAGMPILDESHNLVAVVDRSGEFAMTLGPLATELSSLKLTPKTVASECVAGPPEDSAEGE